MMLSKNARDILLQRYVLKDHRGKAAEAPEKIFVRVAKEISKQDLKYDMDDKKSYNEFYSVMSNLDFLPNSPTLMNVGTPLGQLSACFVLPVEDSINSVFDALKQMATIHKSGGGTGFNFSKIRPKNDIVASSKGPASGPVSFMSLFDKATDVIKQGGRRRGANMAMLDVSHPDIFEFVRCKAYGGFQNFNISVALTDKFMSAVKTGKRFNLVNPRSKKVEHTAKAKEIFNALVRNAWARGDPGVVFIDEVNRKNPLSLGRISAMNPCGEVPLYEYESCNLGSVNLANMVHKDGIDWLRLEHTVKVGVHFLDNVIDANKYPLAEIETLTKANRKIGLGVMGFAEMLIQLRVPYDSPEAVRVAEEVMRFINKVGHEASADLALVRGNFPNIKRSKYKCMRNATVTAIAPTGSISLIADTSSGIEPLFALAYKRKAAGKEFNVVDKMFEQQLKYSGIYRKSLIEEVVKRGTLKGIKGMPASIKKVFVTAHEISPEQHIRIQAAFQRHCDNAVSKTVNLKSSAKMSDVEKVFMYAYEMGCKGVTVYRHGSINNQVINFCETC
ncbi:MAG: adenosylcobalamin-dependent ribonucleoside-diphosphate reductase [Nanoarchaeota archaeon]|nr:adenosylcobalamin-dependent ribonucleoside-diphosphate reductase [Nanoarchaeota archaeon]